MPSVQQSQTTVHVTVTQRQTAPVAPPAPPAPKMIEDIVEVRKPDSGLGVAKKIAGGALLGAGISGVVTAVAKSAFTDYLHRPSASGVALGAALGAGIGLANLETGDKNINAVKNTVSGALIGGSVLGLASGLIRTIGTERLSAASPIAVAVGALAGAGIALLNVEE
ncbi:MAG: hypothetical protein CVV27_00195 [Candidatus Melainabacteria bacterium HGW-Melainabacteria-1]|nr:MAG: hypothetical protein CVV27_00195 [Candidatus Melainabacteria bacterium HGW-Melainabacteria-1]